jgi:DNA mismatch repair ATPase MutS
MFRDRDFDPGKILSLREKEVYSRDEDQRLQLHQLLPWNEKALTQDLGLDILINSMAKGDKFLFEAAKVALMSYLVDTDTILYRQHVLKDCIKQEVIVRNLYGLTVEVIEKEKSKRWWGLYSSPSSILNESVDKLQMLSEMLKKLKNIADQEEEKFESEGFNKLFGMLRMELNDQYLAKIDEHLRRLKFREGVLITADLGHGNKGTNYVLRKLAEDTRNWIVRLIPHKKQGFTYQVHPRDETGTRALSDLRNQGINNVANVLAQSTDHILSFFQSLRTELAFYMGCLNLKQQLTDIQEPVCFPVPHPTGVKKMSGFGLYDICLSLSVGKKLIGNDFNADGKDLIVITGANTGGKSTFMRSLAIAQLMMQAGMFVPAEALTSEVRDSIVTHFKREEDTTMESGKLDEELNRMNIIVDKITSKSMVLFNETFAATNEREGSEIARLITKALVDSGLKVVFVTHLYEFAHNLYEKQMQNFFFLRAERLEDGTRTFRVLEGEPLQTSYGKDLYDKIFQT